MENVFLLMALGSIGCLFVGLIKPALFKKILKARTTRGGVAMIFGIATLASFILFGLTNDQSVSVNKSAPGQPTKASQEKPKTKEELLWDAFDEGVNRDRKQYTIAFDGTKSEATLTKAPQDYWNEVSILKEAYRDFVRFGLQAFNVDGVKKMTLNVKFTVGDQYGKDSIAEGVVLSMTKEQFQKFDWENMKGKNLYADKYAEDFSTQYVNIIIARVIMQKGGEVPLSY